MPLPIVIKFVKAGMYLFISNTVTDPDERLTYNYVSMVFFLFFEAEAYIPQTSLHLDM